LIAALVMTVMRAERIIGRVQAKGRPVAYGKRGDDATLRAATGSDVAPREG